MSGSRFPSVLDTWDAVTRSARPPGAPARATARFRAPLGATVVVALAIAAALALPFRPGGSPGTVVTPTSGPTTPVTSGLPPTDETPGASIASKGGEAEWWVDPADLPIEPDTIVVQGLLNEWACTGGRSPEGRIVGPDVIYTPSKIIVTFYVRPLEGPQTCPSNPTHPVEITLTEPLGDRTLIDGRSGRDATVDPTVSLSPRVNCGPLVGTDDAKVACLAIVWAAGGKHFAEYDTLYVGPMHACDGDECTVSEAIEARTWWVEGVDHERDTSTWTCTYQGEVATCTIVGTSD
jgi:hypothetical protein